LKTKRAQQIAVAAKSLSQKLTFASACGSREQQARGVGGFLIEFPEKLHFNFDFLTEGPSQFAFN
jgi:hypothetical protein